MRRQEWLHEKFSKDYIRPASLVLSRTYQRYALMILMLRAVAHSAFDDRKYIIDRILNAR